MALVLRAGFQNLNSSGLLGGLCKLTQKYHNVTVTQIAGISSRELRKNRPPKPPPFDWRHKKYGVWAYFTDPMFERFDDNTKVVIVEGLPCVGKNKVAKQLAEELDMLYMPPPTYDDILINPYGFDLRSLNDKLPEDSKFYDMKSFLENPTGRNSGAMQLGMLSLRCSQYIDVLAHVLSTGQGVVAQRSPWSDSLFAHAMAKCGFLSRGALDFHREASRGTLHEFLRPHLVVYLDAPVSVIKDNIKKRNIPHEVNSKALTTEYLTELDRLYKEYLRETTTHSHLLMYDWSREGDIGVVVEDIERLDFDSVKSGDLKFHDWHYTRESEMTERRYDFAMQKTRLMAPLNIARFDVPELLRSAEDCLALEQAIDEVPSEEFTPGFNPGLDKGVLFKLSDTYEDWFTKKNVLKQEK